ncbi:MAG: transcriptional repressor [Desulfovibrionaceae bacterium]|nr:transcriptional repressor [Desulfovibrionaceae bacterium]
MNDALSVFIEYLHQNSLKDTPQRRVILKHFLEGSEHYSAEEFYQYLREKGEEVGQATVYRTLKLLCSAGIAKEVNFGDGITRFEVGYGNEHHDHLICELCHENLEVLDEDIEALQQVLAARYGYTLTSHRLYLYGICPRCKSKASS